MWLRRQWWRLGWFWKRRDVRWMIQAGTRRLRLFTAASRSFFPRVLGMGMSSPFDGRFARLGRHAGEEVAKGVVVDAALDAARLVEGEELRLQRVGDVGAGHADAQESLPRFGLEDGAHDHVTLRLRVG